MSARLSRLEKLDSWIDSGDVVISKAQNVVDVVNGDTGLLDESVGSAVDGISDGLPQEVNKPSLLRLPSVLL